MLKSLGPGLRRDDALFKPSAHIELKRFPDSSALSRKRFTTAKRVKRRQDTHAVWHV
jgi:hypothetical protein